MNAGLLETNAGGDGSESFGRSPEESVHKRRTMSGPRRAAITGRSVLQPGLVAGGGIRSGPDLRPNLIDRAHTRRRNSGASVRSLIATLSITPIGIDPGDAK